MLNESVTTLYREIGSAMPSVRRNSLTTGLTLALLLGSLVLTGCGIKGGLKTPPPLWGEPRNEVDKKPDEDSVTNDSPIDDTEDDIFDEDYVDETTPY